MNRIGRVAGFPLAAMAMAMAMAPVAGAVPLAPPIWSPAALESRADAETCLAQAISYEAGHEPEEGQAAVAQVVLNRLHDPAFPKTVCGVVFQGSDRHSGCQFTFTCDGSLARRRPGAAWGGAMRIARAALDGQIDASVGQATHYHAFYVTPAWAAQLTRVARIGAHIFYAGPVHGAPVRLAAAAGAAIAPQAAIFSAWGLQAAVLVPVAGRIRVRSPAGGDEAIPPRAPRTAAPALR